MNQSCEHIDIEWSLKNVNLLLPHSPFFRTNEGNFSHSLGFSKFIDIQIFD